MTTNITKLPLAELIRKHRVIKNITQTNLAKRVGVSQSLISKVEKNETLKINFETVIKLSLILGFTFDEIDIGFTATEAVKTEVADGKVELL